LERGSLHDVKIKLSDVEITANKDILMARSDYFATMFSNNKFIEGETSSVDMSHCSKAVMEKIVRFLFSGAVTFEDLSLAQLLELTHVSEMMLLDEFKDEVENYLFQTFEYHRVNLSELIYGLKVADTHNFANLANFIMLEAYYRLKYIQNDVENSDSFKSLPFHLMIDIVMRNLVPTQTHEMFQPMLEMLDCDLPTTKQIFDASMVWLSENEVTKEERNKIADSLKFEDFTVEELMNSVRDSGLYPGTKIDKRVLELVKKKDNLLKEKDLKIKDQDLKIQQLQRQF